MIRTELVKTLRRPRTWVTILLLNALPTLVAVLLALTDLGPRPGSGPAFLSAVLADGTLFPLAALAIILPLFLPVAVAVVAGDSVAGEAQQGTLRYLLVRPVSRTRLLVAKLVAVIAFVLLAVVVVAAVAYVVGSVLLGDQALAASGLLVEKVGGTPVKTYQPPGVWEEATFGQIKYEQDHGEALYRRGVYVFWRRIVGPTNFFDAASRSVCTVRPSHTNTPLHALTTLNDTTFVEAARALAQRVITTGGATDAERIQRACRLVLSRAPTEKEQEVMLAGLARLKSQYTADPEAATKLLAVGESKRDEKLNPSEHAAYTGLCLAILNMDEALTKE